MQKARLLLVDDNHRNLVALQAALGDQSYESVLAYSGTEALELARKNDFAVILLDVQMPGMDGFEAARMLRGLKSCQDAAIIFVTAHFPEEEFVRKGYAVGATDYLVKPLDLEVLRSKVSLYSAFQQKNALLREREQRIRGMEELLHAERNLSAVLETHPIGIVVADSDGEVIQINGELSKVWGGGGEKASGKGTHGWWDSDDKLLEAVNELMARVLRTGETSRNEFTRYTRDDGTSKTILTTASALRNLDGTVVGVVVVMQDLTEHTHIEQDIVQRMYQLASMHPELKQAIRH
jgi:PAS domain S-box-containing protein